MKFEVMLVIETELPAQTLLSEIVSNLESVDATVEAGCVLFDGNEVAIHDNKGEQK